MRVKFTKQQEARLRELYSVGEVVKKDLIEAAANHINDISNEDLIEQINGEELDILSNIVFVLSEDMISKTEAAQEEIIKVYGDAIIDTAVEEVRDSLVNTDLIDKDQFSDYERREYLPKHIDEIKDEEAIEDVIERCKNWLYIIKINNIADRIINLDEITEKSIKQSNINKEDIATCLSIYNDDDDYYEFDNLDGDNLCIDKVRFNNMNIVEIITELRDHYIKGEQALSK